MGYKKQGFVDFDKNHPLTAAQLIAIEDAIIALENGREITDLTSQFTWTPGTCIHATGDVGTSDTNWLYSNAVDVSAYSQIKFAHIQTTTAGTSLGYCFYDSSMNRVSSENNSGSSYAPVEKIIDVPEGATYFRCMWINTTSANYDESIHKIDLFYCYGGTFSDSTSSSTSTSTGTTASIVPSHWKEYMDTKIAEINAMSESYGSEADCFIFITDQHMPTGSGNDALLMNYIIENTSVKKIIFGGDIVQGGSTDNKLFREYQQNISKEAFVFPMRGNHDTWGNGDAKNFWDIWCRPIEDKCTLSTDLWYYYDDTVRKIRYIVTDSTYASADGTNNLTSDEQISWMQERITELDSEWTVLVFHHGVWTASKEATMPINNDGQKMIDSIDAIYDTAKCSIAGLYVGHCHRDYDTTTDKGYLLVGTTLDCSSYGQSSYDINYPTRTKGTTTEHAFDVVFFIPSENTIKTIRIGAGANREFTYTTT